MEELHNKSQHYCKQTYATLNSRHIIIITNQRLLGLCVVAGQDKQNIVFPRQILQRL